MPFRSQAIFSSTSSCSHLACEEGHGDTAVLLIENGGDLERKNADNKTPLELCSIQVGKFIKQQTSG